MIKIVVVRCLTILQSTMIDVAHLKLQCLSDNQVQEIKMMHQAARTHRMSLWR